jgi:DNA helicase-2/ATP-dependent DNA helicase PcrA
MYNLNSAQKQAVKHTGSPLLIIAGAGTGKTTVITQKIGWLIEQGLAKSDEILALTFTEKAAGEMAERIDTLLPYGYFDMWVMTFHSFCEKILQQHGLDIGLPANFKLLNEFGQWALIKKNLDKFELDYYRSLGNQTKFISALLQHFSRAKDEDIGPAQYLEYAEGLKQNLDDMLSGQEIAAQEVARVNEVANAYHVYQQLLLDNSALDFGDLINYTLKLFRERPAILAKFQKQFKYILVDEFQDTNWAQYELVKMLAPRGENLTVVGDDDQSIFRFRGASMSNILQFKKDYPDASEVVLTQNYRSAQNILDTAYNFIQLNNPNRLEYRLNSKQQIVNSKQELNKKLVSNVAERGVIELLQGSDLQDEVNQVIEKIAELKNKDKELSWNDFAILVRANSAAKDFVNALDIAGLPYVFLASKGLYSRPVVMDIIAYLNLLDNYHESTACYRVLNIPVFKFSHEEIIGFLNLARKKSWSLYEAVKYLSNFSKESAEKIKIILNLIEKHTALVKVKKASEVIFAFLGDSGYLKYLEAQEPTKAKEAMRELNSFLKRVTAFEAEDDAGSVKNFLQELSLELESGEEGSLAQDPEAGPEMIKILTVHAAKGLEFKYVFIVNMVDLRFPTTERKDPIALPDALVKEIIPEGDTHLEEERRLFYVAMTRAKLGLYFSWAPDYGGQRKKKPSRFLIEAHLLTHDTPNVETRHASSLRVTKKLDDVTQKSIYELPRFYSYTQLQSYDKCPHQYFIDHVLKIPKPGKGFFSFGQSMHLTLQKFFAILMRSNSSVQADLFGQTQNQEQLKNTLTLETLLKLYDESWIGDWFEDKKQREEYYKKGREILKEFFNKHNGNWPKVSGLEQGFKLRIGGHLIYGKIDRIDELSNGVQIVDYKTGQAKDEEKITNDQKYQLLLYQLAAEEVLKQKPANLQFYYLEKNSELNFLGSQNDIIKMQEWVLTTIQKIEDSIKRNYFPHSSDPCRFCNKNSEVGEISSL